VPRQTHRKEKAKRIFCPRLRFSYGALKKKKEKLMVLDHKFSNFTLILTFFEYFEEKFTQILKK